MRYLGIDYGEKRMGLALSDPEGVIAQPHGVYQRRTPLADVRYFCLFVIENDVDEIVLGLPLREDGSRGDSSAAVEDFRAQLKSHLDLPIHLLDERYTTKSAEASLREAGRSSRSRRKVVDAVAAALILQAHLAGITN